MKTLLKKVNTCQNDKIFYHGELGPGNHVAGGKVTSPWKKS